MEFLAYGLTLLVESFHGKDWHGRPLLPQELVELVEPDAAHLGREAAFLAFFAKSALALAGVASGFRESNPTLALRSCGQGVHG